MNGLSSSRAAIHRYARILQDCTKAKDLIQESNLFSWTAMISAYADCGEAEEAIHLYQQMRKLGLPLDKYVFLSILKACIYFRCLTAGMWVHAHVIVSGFEADVFIANTLIDMYAKCWYIDDAQKIFSLLIKPDIISWNVIMTGCLYQGLHAETFAHYIQMQKVGMQPNNVTYILALKACAVCESLIDVKKIHVQMCESCFEPDLSLLNTLVDTYAKGGELEFACLIFDEMSQKDTATWNVMIAAYVEEGLVLEAFSIFSMMAEKGLKPDRVTFSTILKAGAHVTMTEHGRYMHFQLTKNGLELDVTATCALIEMYMKCGSHTDAGLLFEKLHVKNLAAWNAMIMGCAQSGLTEKSLALFEQFLVEGNLPDRTTVISIVKACLNLPVLDHSKGNRLLAMELGFLSDVSVGNAILELYVDCGSLEDAYDFLITMHTRDVVSWNTVIVATIQQGFGENALFLFARMLQEQVSPNHITYSSVLKICATLPALEWGMEIHTIVNINACESSVSVGSALVDMYSKCGTFDDAFQVFNSMEERQLVAWTAIIAGCALLGLCRESLRLFAKMVDEGVKPDTVTFVAILSACSRAGRLQEGCYYFLVMNSMCCEVLTAEHVACMVDLLARAGHLHEAKNLLLNMPIAVDAVVWMVLLDACRIHGDIEMGRYACKCTLRLDSGCAQAYVVLSNIYALAGMWDEVSKIREEMKSVII